MPRPVLLLARGMLIALLASPNSLVPQAQAGRIKTIGPTLFQGGIRLALPSSSINGISLSHAGSSALVAHPGKTAPLPVLNAVSDWVAAAGDGREDPALTWAFDGAIDADARPYLAPPAEGGGVDLSRIDPSDAGRLKKGKTLLKARKDQKKLNDLQTRLYADHRHKVLLVLQGMDTSGKDGTIRHVMASINHQGVEIRNFKKPTKKEASHHFLWRIRKALPDLPEGMITVFNRSHYEDILVPTVYGTFPKSEIESRYRAINDFERELAGQGWTILKFFLHISKDEQKARLEERLDDPDKNWKFSLEDLKTRRKWTSFMRTYGRILAETNTPWAPWYVIPADRKWMRNFAVGRILRRTLEGLDLRYPAPPPGIDKIVIPD